MRIGNLHLPVKLTIIGQTDKPPQLRAVVMQIGTQVEGIKRHRQRCVVHLLYHLHVTTRERHATLRQPLFGRVPRDIGFPTKDAAGLSRLRHKRF